MNSRRELPNSLTALAVLFDRPALVTPEGARQVTEVTLAADLSAERNRPVSLPLKKLVLLRFLWVKC